MRRTAARRSASHTGLAAAGALLLGATTLSCSFPGSGPDADDAAESLAKALSAGDLKGVELSGSDTAAADFTAITEGLGQAEVEVGRVSTDGDRATAALDWRWSVASETWSYDTTVELAKQDTADGEAWVPAWDPALVEPSLTSGDRLVETTVKAERGTVLGAGDQPIVTQRPVLRVGLDKSQVPAAQAVGSARRLAQLLDIETAPFVKQVRATGDKAFVQGIVFRRQEAPAAVLDGLGSIPGASAISDDLPLAPTKDFAAAILGTVGPATAELVEESDGRVRAGDDVGLSGLQKRYDEQLAGTRGATVAVVSEEGERTTLFTVDPEAGSSLRTTLEIRAQEAADDALAEVGPPSALVAIRPSTGDLVAVASGPGSKGYNTATFGRYAPGSTFKVVSALALLRSGVTPQTRVPCPPTTVVDGKTFKNYSDYPSSALGDITFEDALANSCNTAFISQRDELAPSALADAAAALGLGVDHDTGFPTFFGEVGEPASETQAAASMIGQGTVLASPMAMAAVVASVAKGAAVLPRLLPDQDVQQQEPKESLTAGEARQLRAMMRAVVERGSGGDLADLPGGPVIAKTGTAEFGDEPPLPTHAWMVAGRGDLAVAVFVERGESGSQTAGPVLEQFLRAVR